MTTRLLDSRGARGSFAAALLAAFLTALAISLTSSGAEQAPPAPASTPLSTAPLGTPPARTSRLRDVAPLPGLRPAVAVPGRRRTEPTVRAPVVGATPAPQATPTPQPTPAAPTPVPTQAPAPTTPSTQPPTFELSQGFDSSG